MSCKQKVGQVGTLCVKTFKLRIEENLDQPIYTSYPEFVTTDNIPMDFHRLDWQKCSLYSKFVRNELTIAEVYCKEYSGAGRHEPVWLMVSYWLGRRWWHVKCSLSAWSDSRPSLSWSGPSPPLGRTRTFDLENKWVKIAASKMISLLWHGRLLQWRTFSQVTEI